MISPTIGRVVWYWPNIASGDAEGNDQPLAALIAHVLSDTCVNLAIFDKNGVSVEKPPTSVLLVQDGNPRPTGGGFCEWMPYQKGQAAKADAAAKGVV